jgi:hypothetical protein
MVMSRFEPSTYHPTCTVVRTTPHVLHACSIGRGEVLKAPPRFEAATLFLKTTLSKPSPRFEPQTLFSQIDRCTPCASESASSFFRCCARPIYPKRNPNPPQAKPTASTKKIMRRTEGKGGIQKRRDEREDPRRMGPIVPVSEAEKDLNKRFSKPQITEGSTLSKNTWIAASTGFEPATVVGSTLVGSTLCQLPRPKMVMSRFEPSTYPPTCTVIRDSYPRP